MKRIHVAEQSETVCDVTGQPAVATLTMEFGYGSNHDMSRLQADLSAATADEVLALLQKHYPQLRLTPSCPK